MSITLTSKDPASELATGSSLSSNLADYHLSHLVSSAPGDVVITAVDGYKEWFWRSKAQFSKVVEKNKMVEEEEERETLKRAQVYSEILSELNEIWWMHLPDDVRSTLVVFGMTDLTSTFASWWLQWEEVSPTDFPLPPSMHHFGPVKINFATRFIFDSTQRESDLSKTITRAWEAIPEISRQLMLFCWSGVRNFQPLRNCLAHPHMEKSTAKATLGQDLNGTFENLHATACFMADYIFT